MEITEKQKQFLLLKQRCTHETKLNAQCTIGRSKFCQLFKLLGTGFNLEHLFLHFGPEAADVWVCAWPCISSSCLFYLFTLCINHLLLFCAGQSAQLNVYSVMSDFVMILKKFNYRLKKTFYFISQVFCFLWVPVLKAE